MRNFIVIAITSVIIIVSAILIGIEGEWNFNVNFIDFITLIVTTALAVIVYVYTLANEKKNLSSDLVIEDVKELCAIYANNTTILSELEINNNKLKEVQAKIRFNFHKADCLIDTINAELEESFKEFKKDNNLAEITKEYNNWLTGGALMEDNFVINKNFLRENETKATHTIRKLRLIIHKLIKQ